MTPSGRQHRRRNGGLVRPAEGPSFVDAWLVDVIASHGLVLLAVGHDPKHPAAAMLMQPFEAIHLARTLDDAALDLISEAELVGASSASKPTARLVSDQGHGPP